MFQFMDGLHDNLGIVKRAPIKMEYLCCEPCFRDPKIAIEHYMASSLQRKTPPIAPPGLSASMLLSHDLWWYGPTWLKRSSTTWPQRDPARIVDETTAKEISSAKSY
ncbi:hypothetical protein HN011_001279, partial [Eciton burchellii]